MLCEQILFSKKNPSRGNQISNYFISDQCSSLEDAKEEILQKVDYAHDEIVPYLSTSQKIIRYLHVFNVKLYVAIISITIIGSVFFLILVYLEKFLTNLKIMTFGTNIYGYSFAGVSAAIVATWICGQFALTAEGSGIAEMKSILTGIEIKDFFTIKTLLAKYFSCIMVKISGLGVGHEGAFIHIIGAFSNNITKLPFFKEIDNDHNRKSVTIAGISASLVIAFGTPIGAMIFALDMCPVNFQMSNMFKCFISVSIAYFIYCLMYNVFFVSTVQQLSSNNYKIGELVWFIGLGLVEGIFCTSYLLAFSKYLVFKRASKLPIFFNRFYYISMVTLIIALVTFEHSNFRFGVKEIISDLTNLDDLHDPNRKISWWHNDSQLISELIYVLICRFMMLWSFSSSAIPFGVFGPGLIIGLVIGRLYGEIICHFFRVSTRPNIFAAAGCGAFLCGFTRSFAPLICVIEITGEIKLLLPMLITNLTGFIFSSIWNIGFLEMIIAIRKLPYLPTFMLPEKGMRCVKDISKNIGSDFLFLDSNLYDIFELLITKEEVDCNEFIPILDKETRRIHSYVKLENCFEYMKSSIIDIERIVIDRKEKISFQLYSNLKQFVTDYGDNAHIIISKRIWHFLKKITKKRYQYDIGQFGSTIKKSQLSKDIVKLEMNNLFVTSLNDANKEKELANAFFRDTEVKKKLRREENDLQKKMIMELLSNVKLNLSDPVLSVDCVPIIVDGNVKLIKVHYMFLMLGVSVIWIQQFNGTLLGKLTKEEFLKFKCS